ncbi:MAG: DUF4347 domain-containing protein [Desmonostoc vinosum HA7617-LM4]|jgi:ELWxxDGT repeat protein|nr:DUF4347 domain-containing protein [Desmonostoc vinosum HA7617-LM4]
MANTHIPQRSIRQQSTVRLVFIDSAVEDYQSLAAGVLPDTEVVILDAKRDGIAQISEVLLGWPQKVNSLHIVSHGAPGKVYLGNTQLSQQTLNLYAGQLMDWANVLTNDACVLLYGCEVARTNAGKAFVQQLSELTGANVAASDDYTGSAAKGGDWELEVMTGNIAATLAFVPATLEAYSAVLAEPYLVKDILPGGSTGAYSRIYSLTNVNGTLYFFSNTFSNTGNDNIVELWKSDGTKSGTVLVKDQINVEFEVYEPYPISVNDTLYFIFKDDINGSELWKSDGTESGTRLVKDINPGRDNSFPLFLTEANGTLYFYPYNNNYGYELWKSDGTESGTRLVKDIIPGPVSSSYGLINVNGTLYFTADNGKTGSELWKSDGTESGTILVKDIIPGSGSYSLSLLTNVNGILYFYAQDYSGIVDYKRGLWKSDGTESGTVLIKEDISVFFEWTNINSTFYFGSIDGKYGYELWKSDGTENGTKLVKDINPGSDGSNPSWLININDTLYFSANDGKNGVGLWKSDGTTAGTVLVKDINPGFDSFTGNPSRLTNVNGTLYFTVDDGINGTELWKSDGTTAGTVLVKNINPGSKGSNPSLLTNVNGILYFAVDDGINGMQLWALNTKPTPYTVSITAIDANAKEAGTDPGKFRISRTGNTNAALTVDYTIGGTGTQGSDYNNLSGSVAIAAGKTSVDITITPVDDAFLEINETVILSLGSSSSYDIDTSKTSATLTIADNDFNGSKKGTSSRDILTGTNKNDIITGFQGADILTGGGGNDWFFYTSLRDARDTITDFVAGKDQIVLRQLFQSLSVSNANYSNAISGGYLSFGTAGSNTTVLIDPDGSGGRSRPTPLVTVQGVNQATLANANNFVF